MDRLDGLDLDKAEQDPSHFLRQLLDSGGADGGGAESRISESGGGSRGKETQCLRLVRTRCGSLLSRQFTVVCKYFAG